MVNFKIDYNSKCFGFVEAYSYHAACRVSKYISDSTVVVGRQKKVYGDQLYNLAVSTVNNTNYKSILLFSINGITNIQSNYGFVDLYRIKKIKMENVSDRKLLDSIQKLCNGCYSHLVDSIYFHLKGDVYDLEKAISVINHKLLYEFESTKNQYSISINIMDPEGVCFGSPSYLFQASNTDYNVFYKES